jgi:hypothetical protein
MDKRTEGTKLRGGKAGNNPKRNDRDADSQDTSDDSTPKATNPDKEGIRPRTVSISSEGDTDSVETRYEIPKEIDRIKLKTVYHHQKEKDDDSSETTESGFVRTKTPPEHLCILTNEDSSESAESGFIKTKTPEEHARILTNAQEKAI